MSDPRSTPRRGFLGTLFAVIGVAVVALGALAWFGFFDVAASAAEPKALAWFLREVREHAVERAIEKAGLEVPEDFTDPARRERGFVHYQEMCVQCHGAPGVEAGEIGKGLNPEAPDLAEERAEPEETFWIAQHGIRMTGMPAFGATHDESALWDIAAFVGSLPDLTPAAYAARLAAEHSHEPAAAPSESAPHVHPPAKEHE
jgi:mono/diheme cytochrome c family protein